MLALILITPEREFMLATFNGRSLRRNWEMAYDTRDALIADNKLVNLNDRRYAVRWI